MGEIMKDKILFGTVLSVILLLSLSWIGPAQVQAAELEQKETLKELSDQIGKDLANNPTMMELIDINRPAKEVILNVFNAESEDEIESYVDDYFDIVDIHEIADRLNIIASDLGAKYEQLNNIIGKEKDDISEEGLPCPDEGVTYYKIVNSEKEGILVTKVTSLNPTDDAIIISTEGAIILPGSNEEITIRQIQNIRTFTLDIAQTLAQLGILMVGSLVVYLEVVFPIIAAVAAISAAIGEITHIALFVTLANFLLNLAFNLAFFFAFVGVFGVLLLIIAALMSQSDESPDSDPEMSRDLYYKKILSKLRSFKPLRILAIKIQQLTQRLNLNILYC